MSENINLKKQLNANQMEILNSEMQKQKKSIAVTYFLLIFLGVFGTHQFYLKNKKLAYKYLFLVLCFLIMRLFSMFGGLFVGNDSVLFLVIIILVFMLKDLFTLASQVQNTNEQIEYDIIKSL